ncbi:helix-turn-helix domain-containing protein [Sphaerisporangium siamense]|uniref:Transcriptional regulator with XRE-family HTH domain n=1 Tax=Sphaerisporangium siamense TaxID=795645 RepID=A0A7W7D8W1_9ACTN|nr:helix-turn-helix transcriptional regulator [Sphaerisporangium siamense]MBB4700968.1 transcriptional regulator with XRE-family HTH domain [Sphaerisporangium siamense]
MTDLSADTPDGNPQLKEMGAFLRAHREARTPQDVGLPHTARRRTPGLRREEVAALSGVGLAWYTWLEQGRVVCSLKVLDSIAHTLGLDHVAYRHLLTLAGLLPSPAAQMPHHELAERTQRMLDLWEHSPALLLDARLDITAWNRAYAAVFSDPARIPESRRNYMWCLLGDPALRDGVVGWEEFARAVLAYFRGQTARRAGDRRTRELYATLRADFPKFRDWWDCQGIDDLTSRAVEIRPAGHVRLHLMLSSFRPVDDPEALVLVQAPRDERDRALIAELVRERPAAPDISGVVRPGPGRRDHLAAMPDPAVKNARSRSAVSSEASSARKWPHATA